MEDFKLAKKSVIGDKVQVELIFSDPFTRKSFKHQFLLTERQLSALVAPDRPPIQQIIPEKTADERELFITGMYPCSLGEPTADFSCPNCGTKLVIRKSVLGKPCTCHRCQKSSNPFEVIDASANLG